MSDIVMSLILPVSGMLQHRDIEDPLRIKNKQSALLHFTKSELTQRLFHRAIITFSDSYKQLSISNFTMKIERLKKSMNSYSLFTFFYLFIIEDNIVIKILDAYFRRLVFD